MRVDLARALLARLSAVVLLCFGVLGTPLSAIAALASIDLEKAGEVSFDELYLEPFFFSREGQGGEFRLGQSSVTFGWRHQDRFRTKLQIGSLEERYTPSIYDQGLVSREIGIIEGFGEYQTPYGEVRLGLLPLNFGYGGYSLNRELIFNRSLLYDRRTIARRDMGLSWRTSFNGFFTELIFHNGEVDRDASDGRVWTTGNWGWMNERGFRFQVSMQTGRTSLDSTLNGQSGLAAFNKDFAADWRFADITLAWHRPKYDFAVQATWGEQDQEQVTGRMFAVDVEGIRMFSPRFGAGLRYNRFDPNRALSNDAITDYAVALVTGTHEKTSRVFVTYTRRVEDGTDLPSDEVRLVWRLIPYF
jgi:hypothetical protein